MNEKQEKFVKLAEQRTNKILKAIEVLSHCSNRYTYEYTDEQVDKIFDAIEDELSRVKSKFKSSNVDRKEFKL